MKSKMLKKLIAVTMALLMMFTSMPFQSLSVFAEEESSSEFVSYTIEYRELKEDGTLGMKLFDSYVATLQYGTSFSAKVPSPTYIGYEPYEKVGDTYEPADEVVIEESGMKTASPHKAYWRMSTSL